MIRSPHPSCCSGRRTPLGIGLLLLCALMTVPHRSGFAQPDESASPSPPSPTRGDTSPADDSEVKASSPAKASQPGFVLLPNAEGEPVPVPNDPTLQEFLRWRADRQQPTHFITSVRLSGTVRDERAVLKGELVIEIQRDDEWVPVTIGLTEAVFRSTAHEGDGEASFDRLVPGSGYRWLFRGRGKHRLQLEMLVPIQKQIPSRFLQLKMPGSPSTELELTIPEERLVVSSPGRSTIKTTRKPNATAVQVFGLDREFKLEWRTIPNPTLVPTQLQAFTSIDAEVGSDSLVVNAWQRINVVQGSVSEVIVTLPEGFELVKVERSEKAITPTIDDPNRPNVVTIPLREETIDSINLKWSLTASLAEANREVILNGFRVGSASRQTGEISLRTQEGFRLQKRESESQFVYQTDQDDLVGTEIRKAVEDAPVSQMYRFLREDFRLVVDVITIPPFFTAETKHELRVAADRLELQGAFTFQVYRGSLDEVVIDWPGSGWTLEPPEAPSVIEEVKTEQTETGIQLRIRLTQRQSELFEIPLRAFRETADDQEAFSLTLPTARTNRYIPLVLQILSDSTVDAEVEPTGQTRWVELGNGSGPDDPAGDNPGRTFRVLSSESQGFDLRRTVHSPELDAAIRLRVEREGDALRVWQQLRYSVRYQSLGALELDVPEGVLQSGLSLWVDDKPIPLIPVPTIGTRPQKRISVELDSTRSSDFELKASWLVPSPTDLVPPPNPLDLAADSPAETETPAEPETVPLAIAPLEPVGTNRVTTLVVDDGRTPLRIAPETDTTDAATAPQWRTETNLEGDAVWTTPGFVPLVELRTRLEPRPVVPYHISKGVGLYTFDSNGAALVRFLYRIEGDARGVTLTLPSGLRIDAVDIDGVEMENVSALFSDDRAELVLRRAPEVFTKQLAGGEGSLLLSISATLDEGQRSGGVERSSLPFPTPGEGGWIEEIRTQVLLPTEYLLLTNPVGMTARTQWERDPVFYRRMTDRSIPDLVAWVNAAPLASDSPFLLPGNEYSFHAFGRPPGTAFYRIHRSALLLLGVGVTLVIAFLLTRFPRTRHPLTVAVCLFLYCGLAVWKMEVAALFLQPVLVGLVLASLIILADARLRRIRRTAVTAYPSDDRVRTGSASRIPTLVAPEDPTPRPTIIGPGSSRGAMALSDPPTN